MKSRIILLTIALSVADMSFSQTSVSLFTIGLGFCAAPLLPSPVGRGEYFSAPNISF